MFTIAVVNQKGGSGKSTLAQCLAVAAYLDDKGVAILDIDPQGSAYKWAQRRKEKDPNPVVKSVTPANHEDEWLSMKNADADLVIFDTPARLSDHTIGPIELADLVIIPTKTTMKDLERVKATYDLIQKTSDKARTFIVINQTRPQAGRLDEPMKYLTTRGFAVCPYSLGYRVAFEDADEDGQTPQEIEPQGKAATEIQSVYRYTIEALHHLTSEGVNHGKELSRTFA